MRTNGREQPDGNTHWRRLGISLLTMILGSCSGGDGIVRPPGTTGVPVYAVIGSALVSGMQLVRFESDRPGSRTRTTSITGLQTGEIILGIDFRPADSLLYALGSTSRVYVLDTLSGVATPVGSGSFAPELNGTAFGVDFNPVADRIRVHGVTGQNLRLHPATGGVAGVDTALAYAPGDVNAGVSPSLAASAYTNSRADATTTTLYAIDTDLNNLVRLASPNDGQITTVGGLGLDTGDQIGFDIAGDDNDAYAGLQSFMGGWSFYRIDLTTGAATLVQNVLSIGQLMGIAVRP